MIEGDLNMFPCPCCDERTLSEKDAYEVCEVCDWEDDPVQSKNPDFEGGANEKSLNQARTDWKEHRPG